MIACSETVLNELKKIKAHLQSQGEFQINSLGETVWYLINFWKTNKKRGG